MLRHGRSAYRASRAHGADYRLVYRLGRRHAIGRHHGRRRGFPPSHSGGAIDDAIFGVDCLTMSARRCTIPLIGHCR